MESIQFPDIKTFIQSLGAVDFICVKDTSELIQITSAVVALANSNGGTLIIGLGRNHKVVGVNPLELGSIKDYISENSSPVIASICSVVQIGHYCILRMDLPSSNLIHSFKDVRQKWKRAIVLDQEVFIANEVIEELLKFKWDSDYSNKQSDICCDEIKEALTLKESLSFSAITSVVNFNRTDLAYNLAFLIFDNQVKFTWQDLQVFYFID